MDIKNEEKKNTLDIITNVQIYSSIPEHYLWQVWRYLLTNICLNRFAISIITSDEYFLILQYVLIIALTIKIN